MKELDIINLNFMEHILISIWKQNNITACYERSPLQRIKFKKKEFPLNIVEFTTTDSSAMFL
jgi:hypothetical protein